MSFPLVVTYFQQSQSVNFVFKEKEMTKLY